MSKIIPIQGNVRAELAAKSAAAGVCALLIINSGFGPLPSPLGVSLASVLPPMCAMSVFACSAFGYLIGGRFIASLPLTLALLIICAFRVAAGARRLSSPAVCAVISAAAVTTGGLVAGFGAESFAAALGSTAISAAIGGFAAYCFAVLRDTVSKNGAFVLNGSAGCALAVCFVLTVATLAALPMPFLNVGRVFGLYITLAAAKKYKSFGAAICGALTCAGAMLCSAELGVPCALLAVAALLTGVFTELNPFVMSFFFISVNAVSLLALGVSQPSLLYLLDCIAAGAIFSAIPGAGASRLFELKSRPRLSDAPLASMRLGFAASVLGDIRESTLRISELLEKRNRRLDVSDAVFRKICLSCPGRQGCWGLRADAVKSGFEELKIAPSIDRNRLPESIKKCSRLTELLDEFDMTRSRKLHGKQAWAQLRETQGMIFDLMKTQEEIIEDIRAKLDEGDEYDREAASIAADAISEACGENVPCAAYYRGGLLRIEAYTHHGDKPDADRLCIILSEALERDICVSGWTGMERGGKLYFCERAGLRTFFAASQRSADGFGECGDSYDSFTAPDGNEYYVLSDGMGHGSSAALDSRICTGLFRKLVCAGVECETAIRLINTSMLMKSCEESFATLDVIRLDPTSGELLLLKSGASATLLMTSGRVICIKAASFPIGIVSNAEPFRKELKLAPGDVAVMLSDGIDEAYYPMIRNMLPHADDMTAIKICEAVSINDKFRRRDDITAAVLRIGDSE